MLEPDCWCRQTSQVTRLLENGISVLGTVPDAGDTSDKTTQSLVGETRQKIVTEVTMAVPVVREYGPGRVKCFGSVTRIGKICDCYFSVI